MQIWLLLLSTKELCSIERRIKCRSQVAIDKSFNGTFSVYVYSRQLRKRQINTGLFVLKRNLAKSIAFIFSIQSITKIEQLNALFRLPDEPHPSQAATQFTTLPQKTHKSIRNRRRRYAAQVFFLLDEINRNLVRIVEHGQ